MAAGPRAGAGRLLTPPASPAAPLREGNTVERLYTPGPTPIPERIRRAMAEPIVHHRTPEFSRLLAGVSSGLRPLCGTREPVIPLACSGTGALEAAFVNLCRRDFRVVTASAGKFGERWTELAQAYGVPCAPLTAPYGEVITPERLAEFMDAEPHTVQAVCLTHSETSTGVLHDVAELARVARDRGALVLVDAITSLAVHELRMDEWGLDAVVAGSQKGLMLPPGLGFVALSARARAALHQADLPRFYFDLERAGRELEQGSSPWTPAISLIVGLRESLALLAEEGLANVYARHARHARATRAAVRAMGLPLFARVPSNGVTAVGPCPPDGGAFPGPEAVLKSLREVHGMRLTGGQGSMKGELLRIGHMGHYTDGDIVDVVVALEETLARLGHEFAAPGAGLRAAEAELIMREPTA